MSWVLQSEWTSIFSHCVIVCWLLRWSIGENSVVCCIPMLYTVLHSDQISLFLSRHSLCFLLLMNIPVAWFASILVLARLLNTLTQALHSSGVDLTHANISVQIDLGKRANGRVNSSASTIKVHSPSYFPVTLYSSRC